MSGNSQTAIAAAGLTKSFPGVRAVDQLSFAVSAGEIFGLVGPDGAGKTTTLRMLAGVMPPDAGGATVAGFDVVRDPEGAKHHLSYMPQRFGQVPFQLGQKIATRSNAGVFWSRAANENN